MDLRDVVVRHTVVAIPPLCPELRLRLVTPACELWRAGEIELARAGISDPYWGFAWPGGQALARWILDHGAEVRGGRVLDFGAGGGVEGVAAALAGASSVLAADVDPLAAVAVRLNAELNGVTVETTLEDVIGSDAGWDVVLGGDVLFDAALSGRALPWLEALAARGARVLLGDPGRGHVPEAALPLCEYDAPADVDPDGTCRRRTTVFALTAARGA